MTTVLQHIVLVKTLSCAAGLRMRSNRTRGTFCFSKDRAKAGVILYSMMYNTAQENNPDDRMLFFKRTFFRKTIFKGIYQLF